MNRASGLSGRFQLCDAVISAQIGKLQAQQTDLRKQLAQAHYGAPSETPREATSRGAP